MSGQPLLGLPAGDIYSAWSGYARATWGSEHWSARPSGLRWLVEEAPLGRGIERDLLLAWVGDRIVASIALMPLPWQIDGQRVRGVSLFDLAAEPGQRSGVGLKLMLAALSGQRFALMAGLGPSSIPICDRLSFPPLPMVASERFYSRSRLAIHRVASAAGLARRSRGVLDVDFDDRREGIDFAVRSRPTDSDIEDALSVQEPLPLHVAWDAPTLRWRFFHPDGPRSTLVIGRVDGRPVCRAVLSAGWFRGVRVGRIVDAVALARDLWFPLLRTIDVAFRRMRVGVAFCATTHAAALEALDRHGWRRRTDGATRVLLRGAPLPESTAVWGGAWDFGLDPPVPAGGR